MKATLNILSFSSAGVYTMANIKWWLKTCHDDYKSIEEEESTRFMYLIDGEWLRLPDYFDARTPNEKFLHIYNTLKEVADYHEDEDDFKQEMAIYKSIKNEPEKVREWLAKNEHLGADKYFMFLHTYIGDDDEMENETPLSISFLNEKDRVLLVDRADFKYTIEFTNTFHTIYWRLLEELDLEKLN